MESNLRCHRDAIRQLRNYDGVTNDNDAQLDYDVMYAGELDQRDIVTPGTSQPIGKVCKSPLTGISF
jgi:hypothetical protein